jgi:signal transduction histidine kinase
VAGDVLWESCESELGLLHALQFGGPWDSMMAAVAGIWLRQTACRSVLIVGAGAGDSLSGLKYQRGGDGEVEAVVLSGAGGVSAFVSSQLFRQVLQGVGLEDRDAELVLWPDLLCGLQFERGEGSLPDSGQFDLLQSVSRRLLSSAAGRSVLLPDPARLEALAEFAAGAGHEINNPLATIIGQAQLQLRGAAGIDLRQSLETIGAQAWRIRDMIGNAMLFARPPALHVQSFRLRGLLEESAVAVRQSASAGISVVQQCEGDPELTADRAQLGVLISHLLRNGCESLRGAGRSGVVRISGRQVAECIELRVEDNGPGLVSAEVLRHAFDPFYSGRSAGRGLGFGLCLSWRIVRQHGGAICLENLPSGGVCCRISLPGCSAAR